jgi:peroxiredoxin
MKNPDCEVTMCHRKSFWTWIAAVSMIFALISASAYGQVSVSETEVPGFSVLDMKGHTQSYTSFRGQITVVIFFSTRCPISNAFNFRRNELYKRYRHRVRFIILDSNANESLEEVKTYAKSTGFEFPVYQDIENRAAGVLGARGTTETFVLDQKGTIRYHGPIEDSPNPERTKLQGLRLAIDAILEGQPVAFPQLRAPGCAIRHSHP